MPEQAKALQSGLSKLYKERIEISFCLKRILECVPSYQKLCSRNKWRICAMVDYNHSDKRCQFENVEEIPRLQGLRSNLAPRLLEQAKSKLKMSTILSSFSLEPHQHSWHGQCLLFQCVLQKPPWLWIFG